jgi:hypothetical protein
VYTVSVSWCQASKSVLDMEVPELALPTHCQTKDNTRNSESAQLITSVNEKAREYEAVTWNELADFYGDGSLVGRTTEQRAPRLRRKLECRRRS